MNGVHDMGGLQCMGPVEYERNEPVFHAPWEGRVYALSRAIRALRKWNIDTNRHTIESLPPAQYLRMSYYERWLAALTTNLIRFGLVTKEEMESGKAAPGSVKATPVLTVAMAGSLNRGIASSQDPSRPPLFKVGASVRARNLNPVGHTRLHRYARGKTGVVVIDHGVYNFPDTNAHAQGEKRRRSCGARPHRRDTLCTWIGSMFTQSASRGGSAARKGTSLLRVSLYRFWYDWRRSRHRRVSKRERLCDSSP